MKQHQAHGGRPTGKMTGDRPAPDRRAARHQATRDELIGHAIDIMGTQGVGGLSLAELARRLGVRTPSLYTYFASKNALYDELFRRGYLALLAHSTALLDRLGPAHADTDLVERVLEIVQHTVTWHLDHPQLGQLMLFRPVPEWQPSAEAYAASLRSAQVMIDELASYRRLGLIRPDIDPADAFQDLANAATGVIARHLSNEPGARYGACLTSRTFPALISAVVRSYQP